MCNINEVEIEKSNDQKDKNRLTNDKIDRCSSST
jgi:hypothetical protein